MRSVFCGFLAVALCIPSTYSVRAQQMSTPSLSDGVTFGKDILIMLPPKAIGNTMCLSANWSETGKYVMFVTMNELRPGDLELGSPEKMAELQKRMQQMTVHSWNRATGKTVKLNTFTDLPNMAGIKGSDQLFVISPGQDNVQLVQIMNVDTGVRTTVWQSAAQQFAMFEPHPEKPLMLISAVSEQVESGEGEATYVVLDAMGKIRRQVKTKEMSSPVWCKEGLVIFEYHRDVEKKSMTSTAAIYDLDSWRVRPVGTKEVTPLDNREDPPEKPKYLRVAKLSAGEHGTTFELIADTKEEPNHAKIARACDFAEVSPDEKAVLFLEAGVAQVRMLTAIDKALWQSQREAAERMVAISNAKQCATAMMMYAADYDDVLPINGGDWKDSVYPYIKSSSIMRDFVYTYSGGNLGSADDPSTTELGYIDGPGGRAVAYLDGHVKWIPNPKPELVLLRPVPGKFDLGIGTN